MTNEDFDRILAEIEAALLTVPYGWAEWFDAAAAGEWF